MSRQELADQSGRAAAWREVITDLQREGESPKDKRHKTGVKPQPKPSDTGLAVPWISEWQKVWNKVDCLRSHTHTHTHTHARTRAPPTHTHSHTHTRARTLARTHAPPPHTHTQMMKTLERLKKNKKTLFYNGWLQNKSVHIIGKRWKSGPRGH